MSDIECIREVDNKGKEWYRLKTDQGQGQKVMSG